MSRKLVKHLQDVQHRIAQTCSPVCAMNAEQNMIGQMEALLRQRRYGEIQELLKSWQMWLESCGTIYTAINEAVIMIRLFCEFYEESNGLAEGEGA